MFLNLLNAGPGTPSKYRRELAGGRVRETAMHLFRQGSQERVCAPNGVRCRCLSCGSCAPGL